MKEEKNPKGSGGRFQLKANVDIVLKDENGKVKDERHLKNIIVDGGLSNIMKQILGDTGAGSQPGKQNYVGVGTGTTSPIGANTTLETEIGTREQDTDPDFPGLGIGRLIVTFAAGNGTGALTESGVFDASTSGTMMARTTFTVINKGSSDSLQITWQFTVS